MFTANARSLPWEELEALQLYSPDGPLCPNIQKLDWLSSIPAFRFFPLFVPPSLRSLLVSTIPSYHHIKESQVLGETISRLRGSTLTELRLSPIAVPFPLTPEIQQQISSLVLRCGTALTSLNPATPLSEPALLHVMTLPNLRELAIHNQPPPTIPGSVTILPSLETLDLSEGLHSQWLSFLDGRHNHIPPTVMIHEPKTPHSTLKTLTLSSRKGLGPATINPTLAFTNLTALYISGSCTAPIDDGSCTFNLIDDDISRLAIALPRLTRLQLGSARCGRNTCKTTFRSFVSLSIHCNELSCLEIHINTENIARDVEVLLGTGDPDIQNLRSHRRCGLTSLNVGHTPLVLSSLSDLQLVARGLLDVFPMVKKISALDGSRVRHDSWSKVLELILELRDNV